MNFLNPEALAFAVTLPIVIIFYLLKRRRVAHLVSSTVIWKSFLNETQANSPFQKLRHNWLLIIQLIFLSLAIFALIRPYFSSKIESGRFVVVILDVSASMQATDVSLNRFELAKGEVNKMIDGMYDNDQMVLILSGGNTEVRQSPTSVKAILKKALDQVKVTDSPTRLLEAIKLSQNLSRNRPKVEVHLFSDGVSSDLDAFELQDLNLEYHRLGKGGGNLGITSLEVRSNPEQLGQQSVFATIGNFSTNTMSSEVSLFFDDQMIGNRRLTVRPTNTASLVFSSNQRTNGVFRMKLKNDDFLQVDNIGSVMGLTRRNVEVLLITKGNVFLEKALRSIDDVDLIVKSSLTDSTPNVDVVVLDSIRPTVWPSGNVMAINTQSTNWFQPSGLLESPPIVDWKSAHPILRFVNFDNVQVAQSLNSELPTWMNPIVETQSVPLIAVGENDANRCVWVGFNPLDSTWPLRVSFPIFIANAIDWLDPKIVTNLSAGEPFSMRMAEKGSAVVVTLPDGEIVETSTMGNGEFVFADTFQQGVYHAKYGTNEISFCVNLLDAAESAIESRDVLKLGKYGRVEATLQLDADKELWRWFAITCLLLLVFEWWFYHRRTA
ncbi:MAG: BatA and WFA domain-containing protein [Verrucomicrobiota bacterium]|nr:BatA and WFA domain-containing protein [Verrucomicrobiota bacterium]